MKRLGDLGTRVNLKNKLTESRPVSIAKIRERANGAPLSIRGKWHLFLTTAGLLAQSSVDGIRRKYAGSVLGSAWSFILPIALLTVYSAVYLLIFKIRVPGMSPSQYVIMVSAGLSAILAFNETLASSSQSLRGNKDLLLNAIYPPRLLPLRDGLVAQATGFIGILLVALFAVALGYARLPSILMLPIIWFLLLMFTLGLGTLLSLLALVLRDIYTALVVIFLVILVTSPIAYAPSMVPDSLQFIIYCNPMSYFILAIQSAVAFGVFPSPVVLGVAATLSLATFAVSQLVFSRAKERFQDFM